MILQSPPLVAALPSGRRQRATPHEIPGTRPRGAAERAHVERRRGAREGAPLARGRATLARPERGRSAMC